MFGRQDCVLLISVFDYASIVLLPVLHRSAAPQGNLYENELSGTLPREWSALERLEIM